MHRNLILHALFCLSFVFIFALHSFACLWPEGKQYQVGKPIDLDNLGPTEYVQRLATTDDQGYWQDLFAKLRAQKREHPVMEIDNNIAVTLAHLGRYDEALTILRNNERRSPGSYFTAANLGTVYELMGKNEEALKWIKEGINRNEDSHWGTEWLHVMILEAKIETAKNPKRIYSNSILNINWEDFSDKQFSDISTLDYLGHKRFANDIEYALSYQLHERLEFVKPPDQIVGRLLYDLSQLVGRSRSTEHGQAVLNLAQNYGFEPPIVTSETPAALTSADKSYALAITTVSALLLVIVGVYTLRRLYRSH
jgi:tetratricopeptide (TPR) repeat protein